MDQNVKKVTVDGLDKPLIVPANMPPAEIHEHAKALLEARGAQQPKEEPYSGAILPFSKDEQGDVSFDSDAGILGAIKRTITGPGDAIKGKFDPMSREGLARAFEGATIISPTPTASKTGVGVFGGRYKKPKVKAPSSKELKGAAKAKYDALDESGVAYSAEAIKSWADDVARSLDESYNIAETHPEIHAQLNKLRQAPDGDATVAIQNFNQFRRSLNKLAGRASLGDDQKMVINGVIARLDEFMASPSPEAVVAGTPAAARQVAKDLGEANANYAAKSRADRFAGLETKVERRAAAANSGRNYDNTTRQKLASLLESAKQTRGLNKEEIAAVEKIIAGGPIKNTARTAANHLAGGGGFGASALVGIGGVGGTAIAGPVAGGVLAAAPLLGGPALKALANKLTRSEMKALNELIRRRSPLYQQRLKNTPMEYSPADGRAALTRALIYGSAQQ